MMAASATRVVACTTVFYFVNWDLNTSFVTAQKFCTRFKVFLTDFTLNGDVVHGGTSELLKKRGS
jgi:hypothetical protein